MTPTTIDRRAERRVLALSLLAGVALALAGLVVGVAERSLAILVDGLYGLVGVALSAVATRVSRLIEAGPTRRHHFGRDALAALVVAAEGVSLLATCVYGLLRALTVLHTGAAVTPGGPDALYALAGLVVSLTLVLLVRRVAPSSTLTASEASGWWVSTVLSLGLLVAFVGALVLAHYGFSTLARDADPLAALVLSLALLVTPWRLLRGAFAQLTEAAPAEETERVERVVGRVLAEHALARAAREVRVTRVADKLYVELELVVSPDWTVARTDRLREDLTRRLARHGEIWLTLECTAHPSWLAAEPLSATPRP